MSDLAFVSYAQNREDVMLWRALSHIKNGFYIDIGANHPCDDSVTKAFYDRGWSGINVEPLPSHLHQLQLQRKRDINLGIAAGSYEGTIEIFDTPIRGLATASKDVAQSHRANGLEILSIHVPVRRLENIWREYVNQPVNFLKIDVEGFEEDVLLGMNFSEQRPWIIVIEATRPNSQEIDAKWEHLIVKCNYKSVYFDGLNIYYIAHEHSYLEKYFTTPPNVFDNYISAEQIRLSKVLAQQSAQIKLSRNLTEKYTGQLAIIESNNKYLHEIFKKQISDIYQSHSWKITAPLRKLSSFQKKIKSVLFSNNTNEPLETNLKKNKSNRWHRRIFNNTPTISNFSKKQISDTTNNYWRIVGHVEGHYSLSAVNRGLATALNIINDQKVCWTAWHGQQYMPGDDIPENQIVPIKEILNRRPVDGKEDVISLVHHYPLIVDPEPAKLKIALFFWEESRVPEFMVAHLNKYTDGVLVASRFVHNALRYSGYKNPIFSIPLGLPEYIYKESFPESLRSPGKDENFRFLHISSAFERKGVDVLLKAFFESFEKKDNVELFIKTFPNPHNDLPNVVKDWQNKYPDAPKVTVELREFSESEMLNLYKSAHAMVLPSRGEGFGLPVAESMALGLPVITTGFGGQSDFATCQTAFLVPYHVEASRSHLHSDGSYWAEPCYKDLAQQMFLVKDLVLSKNKNLAARCEATSNWCKINYRWEKTSIALNVIAKQLLESNQENKRKKITLISPWNTKCGIAEYTQSLIENWHSNFHIEILCDRRTEANTQQSLYKPCWSINQDIDILNILEEMLLDKNKLPQVLLIQHQPSLFNLSSAICNALQQIEIAGVTVVVELHSTLPLTRELRLNQQAAFYLSKLSLIVVHKIEDVNHCICLGFTNNVMLLPLGIIELDNELDHLSRSDFNLSEDDLVLGCFGFLWKHKGVDSVIKSIKSLNKTTGRQVKLLAVTSTPDNKSKELLEEYKNLAKNLGVEDCVIWINNFLPIQQSLKILALADFQIFAYGTSSESASAAVTIGLATKKIVIVSPQPIFSDLSECTYRLSGNCAKDITQAVTEILSKPDHLKAIKERQTYWLSERSWPKVSLRLMNAISGITYQKAFHVNESLSMPNWHKEKQVLVDVSEIVLRDAGTGIQRVVNSVLRNWLDYTPEGFAVRPVCAEPGKPYVYTSKFSQAEDLIAQKLHAQAIEVNPGDIFVGLDLSAHLFPQINQQLHSWRLQGVHVCYVIYDIIPLIHPEYVIPEIIPSFEIWMQSLGKEADRLICISKSVAKDVTQWLTNNQGDIGLPEIGHFHLGANLPVAENSSCPNEIKKLLDQISLKNNFLMVGTVEPRKGYAQALSAMELLWNSGSDTNLIIVGKRGWMVEGLCDRIKNHPQLGTHLHWLEQASDASLKYLYQNCSALLAASEAEGFGLPLVEAAQHGLPIIARDIPVFREIAKDYAFYFYTNDSALLASALQEWIDLNKKGFAPSSHEMPWLSWHESAQQLWREIQ